MRDVVDRVLRVGGEMVLASARGRTRRPQLIDWAERLRACAAALEAVARGD